MLGRNVDAVPRMRELPVAVKREDQVAYSIGPVKCEEGDHIKLTFQVTVVNPSMVHETIQTGCYIVKADDPNEVRGERISTYQEITVAPKSQQVLHMQREDDIDSPNQRIYYNFVVYAVSPHECNVKLELKGEGYGEASIRIKKNELLQRLKEQQGTLEQQQKEIEDIRKQLEDERTRRMLLESEVQQVEMIEQVEQAEISGLMSLEQAQERELKKVEADLKKLEDQPASPVLQGSIFRPGL